MTGQRVALLRFGTVAGLVLGSALLAGCMLAPNLPVEGPDGSLALVVSADGEYELFPEGGAVWVLGPNGEPTGDPFIPEEGQTVQVCDWSPDGWLLLLILETDEHGFPVGGRLVEWAPGEDHRELLSFEDLVLSPRYGPVGTVLYLVAEDEQVSLWSLDLETGATERVQEGVVAFLRAGERTVVLGDDGVFLLLAGDELPVRIRCDDECQMTFAFFPGLLMALDAAGRYLALALEEEPAILSPDVERMPTLYVVDLDEERVSRVATPALSPSFSPDGRELAFVGQALDRPVQEVFVVDTGSGEIRVVPGTEGTVWLTWTGGGLIAAVGEDPTRLLRLEGEVWVDLLAAVRSE